MLYDQRSFSHLVTSFHKLYLLMLYQSYREMHLFVWYFEEALTSFKNTGYIQAKKFIERFPFHQKIIARIPDFDYNEDYNKSIFFVQVFSHKYFI